METLSTSLPRTLGRTPQRVRPRRAGAAVLLLCAAAAAGVQLVDGDGEPYAWDLDTPQPNVVSGSVTYFLDSRGTSDPVSGPISDLTAARAGIAAWEIGSSRIRFQEDPTRSANGRDGTDRVNYVGWVSSGLGRLTLAVTFPTRNGDDILDMDVLFNDRDFQWDTRTPGTSGIADIQAIMTHEWGHALGADHVPLRGSTMYFSSSTGSTAYRSLAPDDAALVGSIYPNDTFRLTTGTLRGRVTRDGATDHRAIHVVAVSLVDNEPAASTLTRPDGRFEMRGLPRGVYRLVAAPTVPLDGAMNAYWTSGSKGFLPSVLRTVDQNPGPVLSVTVRPDEVTTAPDFTVSNANRPFEVDDALSAATPIELGDAVAARLESGGDFDWYAFDAEAGQKVTISILAWHLGSRADPALTLTTAQGVTVAEAADVRSEVFFETRPEGPDLDAHIVAVQIPSTGRYYVKVRNQAPGSLDDHFYVLFVTPTSDAPSAALTSVEADPHRIDADGVSQSTLRIVPREETGDAIGSGATVALSHDGGGTSPLFASDPDGDGTFTAPVTAPTTPGRDRFTVTVTSDDGVATIPDAAIVVYLGPADAGSTEITVRPRRIATGDAGSATLVLHPRDANGEPLGEGRTVLFRVAGTEGPSVGTAQDVGDGDYEAVVTAGDEQGSVTIDALVDGTALVAIGTLEIGFPLGGVAAQARADATELQGVPDLKKKAVSQLRKVVSQTDAVAAALLDGNEKKAVQRVEKALLKFVAAEKKAKGLLPSLGSIEELASAIRQAADERLATAVIRKGKDQKRLDAARDLLLEGDAFLDAGVPKKAGARYAKAYRLAVKLQP
jgi:hypothetical protein